MLLVLLNILLCGTTYVVAQGACDYHLDVVTDYTVDDCYAINNYYYKVQECLPTCIAWPRIKPSKCDEATPCPYGYKCVSAKCADDTDSCSLFWATYNTNKYFKAVFKPKCDKDGKWATKQCKGDKITGRCFCYDSVGNRLFGQEWTTKADDMTCACSRKKADLKANDPSRWYVSLHCDSTGNFEPLQCDVESEQCWCVDNKSGEITSIVVPQKVMNKLPCYELTKVGSQYLRQCESKKYAQTKILHELALHGTTRIDYGLLLCDDDGTFGPYRVQDGAAYCTWKDNTNIGTWQSDASIDLDKLDCNCARDHKIFELAGNQVIQQCTIAGNYKKLQEFNGKKYCVDLEGFRKTPDAAAPGADTDCDSYIPYPKI